MTAPPSLSELRKELSDHFASTLRLPVQQIGTDVHILELGVDSIMLIEAQRWLKSRFGILIEVQQFFEELNTIDRLAAFLAESSPRTPIAAATLVESTTTAAASQSELVRPAMLPSATRPDNHLDNQPGNQFDLMRAQLALLRDVIETQNRLLTQFHHAKARQDDA